MGGKIQFLQISSMVIWIIQMCLLITIRNFPSLQKTLNKATIYQIVFFIKPRGKFKKPIICTSTSKWSDPHSANPVYYYCSSTNLPHFVLVAFSLFDEAKTVAGSGFLGPKTLLRKNKEKTELLCYTKGKEEFRFLFVSKTYFFCSALCIWGISPWICNCT